MRRYSFVTVDVFTNQRFGGNPLAVFPDARGMSDAEMQSLAAEFNLSETTFVLPPENPANTAWVRIFTRTTEMPFAGHPNVGTGYVLAQQGRDKDGKLLFEELAGLVEVQIERDGAGAPIGATIAAPQPLSLGVELPVEEIAACANLKVDDVIVRAHRPVQASLVQSLRHRRGRSNGIGTRDAGHRSFPQVSDARERPQGPARALSLCPRRRGQGAGADVRATGRHFRRSRDG